jgi:hypothetical protein
VSQLEAQHFAPAPSAISRRTYPGQQPFSAATSFFCYGGSESLEEAARRKGLDSIQIEAD